MTLEIQVWDRDKHVAGLNRLMRTQFICKQAKKKIYTDWLSLKKATYYVYHKIQVMK